MENIAKGCRDILARNKKVKTGRYVTTRIGGGNRREKRIQFYEMVGDFLLQKEQRKVIYNC